MQQMLKVYFNSFRTRLGELFHSYHHLFPERIPSKFLSSNKMLRVESCLPGTTPKNFGVISQAEVPPYVMDNSLFMGTLHVYPIKHSTSARQHRLSEASSPELQAGYWVKENGDFVYTGLKLPLQTSGQPSGRWVHFHGDSVTRMLFCFRTFVIYGGYHMSTMTLDMVVLHW